VVLQQLAQLGLLRGRHHAEHRRESVMIELGQKIRGVVRGHPAEHLRRLLVRARLQKLHLVLGVELLENVGRQLHVALDGLDDLLAFLVRCALHQVCDLGGVQPAQALQRHQKLGRRDMPDERLHVLPIEDGVAAKVGPGPTRNEAPEHRARAAVDA